MLYFNVQLLYASHMCMMLFYAYNIASIGIPFAFVTFSVHRLCFIMYHHTKPFLKTKRWVMICIASQWISECVISLPFILKKELFCINQLWLRIYTFIMTIIVPIFINIVLNVFILVYVRSITRRVQSLAVSTITNGNKNQQPNISRRELSLLRQMIFMFSMFIGGWTPVFFILFINQLIYIDVLVYRLTVLLSELSVLSIIINLFICNLELRKYLINKVRQCVQW